MEVKAASLGANSPQDTSKKLTPVVTGAEFAGLIKNYLSSVNKVQLEAEAKVSGLASGKDPDILGTMISLTKAELKFRLLLQTRNKVLSAYEEIMRMQL
ncbi:flagellar hook-basal body complex protein FliE [Thermosulfuriphilus sp.]